jgi:hypothetical protein
MPVILIGLLIIPVISFAFEDAELESAARRYRQRIEKRYGTKENVPKPSPSKDGLIGGLSRHWLRPLLPGEVDEKRSGARSSF